MAKKLTKKDYVKFWESHIKDFDRLKWNLDVNDWLELRKAKRMLSRLVEKASKERERLKRVL